MSTGIIAKTIPGKEFGFITPDDKKPEDRDLFFHRSSLVEVTLEDLHQGDKVSFDVESSEKGPNAVNVKKM